MRAPATLLTFAATILPATAFAGGAVRVGAMVEGARILVDDMDQGVVTPAVLPSVNAGEHTVTAISGCQRGDEKVVLTDGKTIELFIEMAPTNGTIVVQPIPSEAHVSIDGMPVTGTIGAPIDVNCGSHAVAAQYAGFQPTFVNIDVGPGEELVLPLQLEALGFGRLIVAVTPDDSGVFIDDNQLSVGPVDTKTVVEGPHIMRVDHEGHESQVRQFVLQAGKEARFDITLEPLPGYKAPRDKSVHRKVKGTTIAGVALSVGGLAAGGFAAWEYTQTSDAHDEYTRMMDRANETQNTDLAGKANDYYDESVQPHLVNTWAAGAAGAALLAGGVTVVFAF